MQADCLGSRLLTSLVPARPRAESKRGFYSREREATCPRVGGPLRLCEADVMQQGRHVDNLRVVLHAVMRRQDRTPHVGAIRVIDDYLGSLRAELHCLLTGGRVWHFEVLRVETGKPGIVEAELAAQVRCGRAKLKQYALREK